jgi:hypothetical protein
MHSLPPRNALTPVFAAPCPLVQERRRHSPPPAASERPDTGLQPPLARWFRSGTGTHSLLPPRNALTPVFAAPCPLVHGRHRRALAPAAAGRPGTGFQPPLAHRLRSGTGAHPFPVAAGCPGTALQPPRTHRFRSGTCPPPAAAGCPGTGLQHLSSADTGAAPAPLLPQPDAPAQLFSRLSPAGSGAAIRAISYRIRTP